MSESNMKKIGRRGFLKAALGTAGLAAVGAAGLNVGGTAAQASGAHAPSKAEYKFTTCDMCFNRCGAIARVENGIVRKLDPNPKFLKSRGMLCARGNAGIAGTYDPDRLKYPLLRKGERGEGKWERVSWDKALDYAAEKLKAIAEKYTRCGVMFTPGSDFQSQFVSRFAEVFGSFNMTSHESLCLLSNNRAFLDTFGEVPFPDLLYSKYVIMSSANRFEALVTPDSMDLMTAMKNNGCKLVVIDPRYTKTAALADEWYAIHPGTDMAFFLAMAHVIINEKLYNAEWIESRTYGLEQLRAHVQKYDPRWAAQETGIPAEDIVRLAREISAAAPAAMVYPGRRSSDYGDSTQIRRSYAIVNALLGNWDQPGGLLGARAVGLKSGIPYEAPWYDENPPERIDAHMSSLMFEEEGSFKHMRDAIIAEKPYPVKGWISYKTNFMQSAANRNKTIEMIRHLDFMMVVDIAMTDTAWMADLVLPAPSYLERMDPASALQGSSACACVVMRDPVIPTMFESRDAFSIFKDLAGRLGLGEFFDFTMEDFRKAQLAGLPDAMPALASDGVYYNPSKVYGLYEGKAHKTLSQKIEMFNQRYAEKGLDPLPVYTPPAKTPENRFRLVVGRNAIYTHCSTQNNALLHDLMPENSLWMHPEPAGKLGLKDGDKVLVESAAGKGELKLWVTGGIEPATVYMPSGFGSISKGLSLVYGNGASIAEVLEDKHDVISGNMAMHETFVSVSRRG